MTESTPPPPTVTGEAFAPESEFGQIAPRLEAGKGAGCTYHVCHVSAKAMEILRAAEDGVDVTCEATVLDDSDRRRQV